MRYQAHTSGYTLKLSARETDDWSTRPGASWPCSTLAGRAVVVEVDSNGLCDFHGPEDCDGNELEAIVSDHLPADGRRWWPTWEG